MKRIPIRVLLVDDEPLVLEQLRQRFLNPRRVHSPMLASHLA